MANEVIIRTEDIKDQDLLDLYAESSSERKLVEALTNKSPVLLIGSRGTGKTMLLRVAELKLDQNFSETRIIAIKVSFDKTLFINAYREPILFRQWMLSKILFSLKRKIQKLGLATQSKTFYKYFEINSNEDTLNGLDEFINLLENSYRNKDIDVPSEIQKIFHVSSNAVNIINELDYFKALIEDICNEYSVERIIILFDEACHNFIPLQQREFFTLFRDLRSPYITCKAAVYPGITSYGNTFQKFHDATIQKIDKDITDSEYVGWMRQIVKNQVEDTAYSILESSGDNFNALIYASSGNPRLLLKSLLAASDGFRRLRTEDVNSTIKTFYRSDIWQEHTKLGEIYKGHKPLIDWGRIFIDNNVLKDTEKKNSARIHAGTIKYQTIYFMIHKDAPEAVKIAVKILEYSGVISLHSEGIKGTKSEIYDRYQINLGILLSIEQFPNRRYGEIITNLSIQNSYLTEYGMNSPAYSDAPNTSGTEIVDLQYVIKDILEKDIEHLDLSPFQKNSLRKLNINSLADLLQTTEDHLTYARYIGNKRARQIYNIALSAANEYISG